jgi:ElaB/YqjD/DUF883 family membrane-anchored ribosome-binding protein
MLPSVRTGTQREGALKKVFVWLFVCAVLTHSSQSLAQEPPSAREVLQPSGSQAQPAPAAQNAARPAASQQAPAPAVAVGQAEQPTSGGQLTAQPDSTEPPGSEAQADAPSPSGASEAAAQSAPEPEATGESAPLDTAASEQAFGTSKLQSQLRDLSAERDSYSRFLPWLTVGVGAATTLGGAIAGVGYALGCDTGCSSPAWVGMVVVTGTFVATIGAVWVVHADAGLRELDSRRYYLQQELDRIRASSKGPEAAYPNAAPLVSWRFALR